MNVAMMNGVATGVKTAVLGSPLAAMQVGPMSLDVGDFDNGHISFRAPVYGRDLKPLSIRLNCKVGEMAHLMGVNSGRWYGYTSCAVDKSQDKFERARGKLAEDVRNAELRLADSQCSAEDRQDAEQKLTELRQDLAGLTIEKALGAEQVRSAEASAADSKYGPDKPVDLTAALLARFYDVKGRYVYETPFLLPDFATCMATLPGVSETDVGVLLGCDATAGYRWKNRINLPSPSVMRLMVGLSKWLKDEPVAADGVTPNIEIWRNVVERERALRG